MTTGPHNAFRRLLNWWRSGRYSTITAYVELGSVTQSPLTLKLTNVIVDEAEGDMTNCRRRQPGIREDEMVDGLLGTDLQPTN